MIRRVRRVAAKPLRVVADVLYEAELVVGMVAALVSGEASEAWQ